MNVVAQITQRPRKNLAENVIPQETPVFRLPTQNETQQNVPPELTLRIGTKERKAQTNVDNAVFGDFFTHVGGSRYSSVQVTTVVAAENIGSSTGRYRNVTPPRVLPTATYSTA